ncbi:MAG: hypothetical protein AAFP08_12370, partial [Bacteroidota bacterium]
MVQVDGRKLRWQPSDSLFLRQDWNVDNMKIFVKSDTLLYSLRDHQRGSRISHNYKRLGRTNLGRIALFPIRVVDKTIRYIDRGIGNGNWKWYSWPFYKRTKTIYGYVSSSQPIYRPGDTVRISIYCSTYRGRPIKKTPTVTFRTNQFSLLAEVNSEATGHYELEAVIGDDWPLDQSIQVEIKWPKNKRWRFAQSYSIRIEDYQLDEYELTIDAPDRVRPAPAGHASAGGEVLKIKVTAEDLNNRPVSGGRLNLTLTTEEIIDIDQGYETSLRDTIWSKETILTNQTEFEWMVPDSLLPDSLDLKLLLKAKLIAPGGELKQAVEYIVVERRKLLETLSLKYEDGQLIINGPEGVATTIIYTNQQDQLSTLPDTIPLPKENELIQIISGPLRKTIDKQTIKDLTRMDLGWPGLYLASPQMLAKSDSLELGRLFLPVPPLVDMDFRWSVTTPDGRQIAIGLAADLPTFLDINPSDHQLWINYQRRISGEWVKSRQALSWALEKLEIDIAQVEQVQPGQESEVTLNVHDQAGNPVRGAVLSSGTYNARFDRVPYSNISAKTGFSRYEPKFYLSEYQRSEKGLLNEPNFFALVEWQDLPIIQLQYPPASGYIHYRDLPEGSSSDAELAVFVRAWSGLENIRSIWVNGEIQYLDVAWGSTPYSIPLDSGTHEIEVRTHVKKYTRTIEAIPGKQLVLSFNRKYAGTSGWSETSMEAFPTDEEWNRIKPRLMSLRAKPRELSAQPVWMAKPGGPVYFRASTNYNRHLGLFDANDSIDVIAAWIDSTRILYEPGFSYDIRTDRDRLYPIARIDRSNRSITRIFPGF